MQVQPQSEPFHNVLYSYRRKSFQNWSNSIRNSHCSHSILVWWGKTTLVFRVTRIERCLTKDGVQCGNEKRDFIKRSEHFCYGGACRLYCGLLNVGTVVVGRKNIWQIKFILLCDAVCCASPNSRYNNCTKY